MPVIENFVQEEGRQTKQDLRIALPEPSLRLEQDVEWCLVDTPDGWREIRFHDYSELYEIPGLYEKLFYEILDCSSPSTIRSLIEMHAGTAGTVCSALRVLDLGAGNGMVGEELAGIGADAIVGVDIFDSAKAATERDRPGVYTDYLIVDMTDLEPEQQRRLQSFRFNCLTCVAALGFGDIPPLAFVEAYRLIEPGGLIAFNLKSRFLTEADPSGFARLIKRMLSDGILTAFRQIEYPHRLATSGDPLHYIAMVGRKEAEIPLGMFE